MQKVHLSGSLGPSIYSSLSHTRPTVEPTHHFTRSFSPLMLPRPRSRPSMISPSPSFNHSPVVTWISVGSPTAGTTLSSYPTPTSPTTYVWPFDYLDFANDRHSKIHITFHFTQHQYILTNFQVTCWGYPKAIVPSTVLITPAVLRQYPS